MRRLMQMTAWLATLALLVLASPARAVETPVLWYDFEGPLFSGSPAPNRGSLGDGTVVGNVATVPGNAPSFTPGNAGSFGVGNDFIQSNLSSNALGVNQSSYTAAAWVLPTQFGGGQNDDGMIFGQESGSVLHLGTRGTGGGTHFGHWGNDSSGPAIQADEWTHVTWRYRGNEQAIFINGTKVSSEVRGPLNNGGNVIIGTTATNEDRDFVGGLDDVVIYNDALSSASIAALAAGGDPTQANFTAAGDALSGRITKVGRKVGGAAFELNQASGATGEAVPWQIVATSTEPTQGLKAELFTGVQLRNAGAWDSFLAGNAAADAIAKAPNINFANSNGGPGGTGYYPEWEAAGFTPGSDQGNYSARLTGEIFIPQAGTYRFKDGNDDYTFLSIDGDTLIDDDTWTSTDGTSNGGSPIVSKTFSEAGWFDIDFRMGEGGGGDSGVLYWDAGDPNNPLFPTAADQAADPSLLIPEEFFRSDFLAQLSGTSQIGDLMTDEVFMNAAGEMLEFNRTARYTLSVGPFVDLAQIQVTLDPVPEPATGMLGLLGLAALGFRRRRNAA